MSDFLEQLNESQRAAVMCTEGPSLIVAGAGSGKTRVLTYRIAYLLQQGVPAGSIMALTFTNKAAREMKERIVKLVGQEARYLMMGTFHSVCGKLLRPEAEKLGYTRDFTIYDTTDSKSLLKNICKELGLDDKIYKPGLVLSRISSLKNSFVSPENYGSNLDLQRIDKAMRLYQFYDVYKLYQARMKASNAMDFDDMLLEVLRLMHEYPEVRNKIQQQYRYILVDEYQDTNHVQYLLVKELAEPQNNICVVGDDSQSIYSFRGADINNILDFQKQYSNVQLFKLERNYRSTKNIVNASNSLILNNGNRIPKKIYSEKKDGSQLSLTSYATDREEAKGVVSQIIQDHSKLQTPYNDIAILYRTNAQSRLFEDELRNCNVPYRIYGNISFYQRKEIKDIISYLRLAVNPSDNEAIIRASSIYSGIGQTSMKKVALCATEHNSTYLAVMQNPDKYGMSGGATVSKLIVFASKISELADINKKQGASAVLRRILEITETPIDVSLLYDQEEIDRTQNILSFVRQIQDYEEEKRLQERGNIVTINEFLYEVSLLTDQDDNQNDFTDRITLMTIHSAKGLEFQTVFITGLENGVFPSSHDLEDLRGLEEERRLFYVAITRAMERCYLCYAKRRFVNGESRLQTRSMFLNDIGRQYIKPSYAFESYNDIKPHWTFNCPSKAAFSKMPQISSNLFAPKTPVSGVTSSIASSLWKAGDRVSHRVFGNGTVVRVYRDEVTENDKIEIRFDVQGVKTLLLTHAKLERI
ncbi:MAG: exodeoxyribonuclease V subunit gamma [Paludibacteraceae bacterium]|nr:exodeoxyribonuclease V subunit gamma [Paludibacteraceae bacterium]